MSISRQDVDFESGQGPTVQIGYTNPNGQRCCGTLGIPGTDHLATAHKVECSLCGYVYGANSTEVWQRKCPNCQRGKAGIRFWLLAEDVAGGTALTDQQGLVDADSQGNGESATDWLRRIAGTFKDDPGFEEMVRLGREYRQADRPTDDESAES